MNINIAKKNEPSKIEHLNARARLGYTPTQLIREPSPTSINRTLTGRVTNLSPSPMRRPAEVVDPDDLLVKEFQYHKLQEKRYAEKIALLKQENLSLKKKILKNENDVKLKSAKLENDNDRIIEVLAELIGKKQISLNIGNDIYSTKNERMSDAFEEQGEVSHSKRTLQHNRNEISAKINSSIKDALAKNNTVVSGSLRALGRIKQISK